MQHPLFQCSYRPASPKKRGRPSKASLAELEGKEPVYKGVQCRQAASWRKFCPVADLLPDSIGPQKLVALLHWCSQLTGIQKAAAYTGYDRGTVGKIYNIIRSYLVAFLLKQNTQLLGNHRHICCVDECFLAKRKPSKVLRGRSTRPMRILGVGIVELDRDSRKETGRVVLRLVRNRSSRTLTNLVRSVVRPGTTVVTDEWRGYNGLTEGTNMRRSTTASTRRSMQKVWKPILRKAYSPGFGDSCARTTSGCLRAKTMGCCLQSIAGDVVPWGSRPCPPDNGRKQFSGVDHEGGSSTRLPGQASFLQARDRMARFKGLLLLKHS